jgi:hypothetical protein
MKEEMKDPHLKPVCDHKTLLNEYAGKLRSYRSNEEKARSFFEDYNIGGLVRII